MRKKSSVRRRHEVFFFFCLSEATEVMCRGGSTRAQVSFPPRSAREPTSLPRGGEVGDSSRTTHWLISSPSRRALLRTHPQ